MLLQSECYLDEVISSLGSQGSAGAPPVARQEVRKWISSAKDLKTQGALCAGLLNHDYLLRVIPPLEFSDFHPFVSDYFIRCIKEDVQTEWVDSRYEAAHALANWFKSLERDKSVPRRSLVDIKHSIESILNSREPGIREALLNGTVEHIFESETARKMFEDWKNHPDFSDLYAAACEWIEDQS